MKLITSLVLILTMQSFLFSQKKSKSSIDIKYMDKSIAPSEDFFLFCNGKWVEKTKIPASESRWSSFNELEKTNKEKLIAILKECTRKKGEKGSQNQLLGDYFSAYINFKQRNKSGLDGLKEDFKEIEAISSKSDIVKAIASLHMKGVNALFYFGVSQDLKEVDRHICYLRQSGIGLPNKDYYLKENKKEVLDAYFSHVARGFELLGKNNEEAINCAKNVLFIENFLASAMYSPAELRSPEKTYNKKSIEEASRLFGAFRFPEYLKKVHFEDMFEVVVSNPSYVETCGQLLVDCEIKKWKDYLSWCLFNKFAGHLSEELVDYNFDFYGRTLKGKQELKPVYNRCIDEITRMAFGELLGKAFIEKHFSENAKNRVNSMVDDLLSVYESRINNLGWMSKDTKIEALKKLNAIGRKLGFPSKWEDYSSLNFSKDSYLNNLKEAIKYSIIKNHEKMAEPVDRDKWSMPAHMVNAYYHPLLNEIAFPAGIMQAPFFDENYEDAVNYGRIGMVIGHEFTHGFDDKGSKFAADGTFKNWWTKEDRKLFEKKTTLYGQTFAGFCPMEDHCVQPDLTMGENIADLGGLIMAFHAFKKTKEGKENKKLNGFTAEQRFFIAYAQLWKIKYTDEEMKNRIATDPHSPGMYRVNGPLMNCTEFFKAFSIEEGSKMRNPKNKISKIW
ncbi:MAG: M13 family metallopeptidase [Crocinitomicaceae bacterium]|nr:M13 family metallopeptidase [Crocinitomicaceae bacterium]